MQQYPQLDLVRFAAICLSRRAVPRITATVVASALVRADVIGAGHHGLARLNDYLDAIVRGEIDPAARPVIGRPAAGCLTVFANRSLGVYALRRTAVAACHALRRSSVPVGFAVLQDTPHVGRLGDAVEYGVAAGYVTVVAAGGVLSPDAVVSPPGGVDRVLGTNPIAVGVPDSCGTPFLFDASTAAIAFYALKAAADRGISVPPGTVVDATGRPSVDPQDFFNGGSIRPAGGHRGFGLSLAAALVGQVGLSRPSDTLSSLPPFSPSSVAILLLDPARWGSTGVFLGAVRRIAEGIRSATPVAGSDDVRMPGDGARARADAARRHGVPLSDDVVAALAATGHRLDVPFPDPITAEET